MVDTKIIKEIENQVVMQAANSHDGIQGHRNRTLASHHAKPARNAKAREWRADTDTAKIELRCA